MKFKFFIERRISTKSNNAYLGFYVSYGTMEKLISVDETIISIFSGLNSLELLSLPAGKKIDVNFNNFKEN